MGLIKTIKSYFKTKLNHKFEESPTWYDVHEAPENMSVEYICELKSKYNIIFFDSKKRDNNKAAGFKANQ